MKRTIYIILAVLVIVSACKKDDETNRTSGTDSINNKTYSGTTYYYYGFSFSQAKSITTLVDPWPDIVLFVNIDTPPPRLTFRTNNFKPSFSKIGDFSDEASAKQAFSNLQTVGTLQWTEMADPIQANQVWVYLSENEAYTKIRIISTINEEREGVPYGECTFEWVHQPDGSSTFSE